MHAASRCLRCGPPDWIYIPELLAKPVPRYTSYPTAAEFGDAAPADLAAAIDAIAPDADVSLYVHIPYCREICWYCGCNTGAANRVGRLRNYLDHLHREIALVARRLGDRGRVGRIAFGGGSPNAIAPAEFDRLANALLIAFRCEAPVLSVEIDPRGFDADWAAALRRNGVSRASLGVQTLAPHVQAAIGREQPLEVIARAVHLLVGAGITSLNFDVMYGLPSQTDDDLLETLERCVELGPDRFAVFGYAHVPHLVPRQRRIDAAQLPDCRARFFQAELAQRALIARGYQAIGFDHFALAEDALARAASAGTLRRNFQGFTEDPAEILIGLGASAISIFPDRILQNEKNSGTYQRRVEAGEFAVTRGIPRSPDDQRRGAIIESLLTHGRASVPLGGGWTAERERLRRFEAEGLLAMSNAEITLAPDARPYARVIAAVFDAYRQASAVRFSAAV